MEITNSTLEENQSVFTELKPLIYSKRAIWGFSIVFTCIFGGVLLMQNLRDIGKKKEGNIVLGISVLYTVLTIFIVNIPSVHIGSLPFLCNAGGGLLLTEYFYKKYFPDENEYYKKKIWKPLIISIVITIPFILAAIYAT